MRHLLVHGDGEDFILTIPDDAKVTFGPWSPPTAASSSYSGSRNRDGTLRVYKGSKSTENVMAVFGGVRGFRDMDLEVEVVSHKPPAPPTSVTWEDLSEEDRDDIVTRLVEKTVIKAEDL
jgi:hypothetical protein